MLRKSAVEPRPSDVGPKLTGFRMKLERRACTVDVGAESMQIGRNRQTRALKGARNSGRGNLLC